MRYASGKEFYGVLGMDFLSRFAIEIDFDRGVLAADHSAGSNGCAQGEKLKLTTIAGSPSVELELPGHREQFLFDTGANVCSVRERVFDSLVASNGIVPSSSSRQAMTGGGEVRGQSGYVTRICTGPFLHEQIRLDRDRVSSIGLRYLSRFKMRCDFPNHALYLSKGNQYGKPEPTATTGLGILEIRGQKIVASVEPSSAAADAGIQFGDIILSVEGKPASELDMHELSQIMTLDIGRSIDLSLLRRSGSFAVTVVSRSKMQAVTVAGSNAVQRR